MTVTNLTPAVFENVFKNMTEDNRRMLMVGIDLDRGYENYKPLGTDKLAIQTMINSSLMDRDGFNQRFYVDQSRQVQALSDDQLTGVRNISLGIINDFEMLFRRIASIDEFKQNNLYIILCDDRYNVLNNIQDLDTVYSLLKDHDADKILTFKSVSPNGERIFSRLTFTVNGKPSRQLNRKNVSIQDLYITILQNRIYELWFPDKDQEDSFVKFIGDENVYASFMGYLNIIGY
jgi:hypothetical protein